MNPGAHPVRRATLDDLPSLHLLWESAQLPVSDLDKRFTEFQVVELSNGDIAGAIGLQIHGQHGKIHSEAFGPSQPENEMRAALWDRIQRVAHNYGLIRLWTREKASFWTEAGFEPVDEETLKHLPPDFGGEFPLWLTLKIRAESAAVANLEKQLEIMQQNQRERTERIQRQAKTFKVLAVFLAALFLILLLVLAVYMTNQQASPEFTP